MPRLRLRYVAEALDVLLNVLKWPLGVAVLVLLPGAVVSATRLLWSVLLAPRPIAMFAAGAAGYYLLWRLLLRRPALGELFTTLEHELTHALFALLTLHPVVAIRATWRGDGVMRYLGKGNWLITLSPYFFPTLSALLMLIFWALPEGWHAAASVLLGITVCYHFVSTWREIHAAQPDLKKVGYPFALVFLPTANLISFGAVLAFAHGGGAGLGRFLANIGRFTAVMVRGG